MPQSESNEYHLPVLVRIDDRAGLDRRLATSVFFATMDDLRKAYDDAKVG